VRTGVHLHLGNGLAEGLQRRAQLGQRPAPGARVEPLQARVERVGDLDGEARRRVGQGSQSARRAGELGHGGPESVAGELLEPAADLGDERGHRTQDVAELEAGGCCGDRRDGPAGRRLAREPLAHRLRQAPGHLEHPAEDPVDDGRDVELVHDTAQVGVGGP
jgi:hypothetical protein